MYRIKDQFPDFNCKKTTFFRYVKDLREQTGYIKPSERPTSFREETPPGYEAQVDFGQFKMKDMYDRNIRVYFFCMVLSYSRMRFVYFSREPFRTKTAVDAHKFAFRYFGGRTQTILYDQDRLFVVSESTVISRWCRSLKTLCARPVLALCSATKATRRRKARLRASSAM